MDVLWHATSTSNNILPSPSSSTTTSSITQPLPPPPSLFLLELIFCKKLKIVNNPKIKLSTLRCRMSFLPRIKALMGSFAFPPFLRNIQAYVYWRIFYFFSFVQYVEITIYYVFYLLNRIN